jgi:hypothetical protein
MGKRELLIIVGFVVVGALAYQCTAPPATGNSGFSFGDIFKEVRREVRGNPGRGTFVHTATIEAPPSLREVRIVSVAGAVEVIGESRTSVAYEFTVSSNGPDDAGAVELAKQTLLERDDLGDAIILRGRYPEPGSQTASLVIRVPERLAVRVESARGVKMSNLAAAHLEGNRGDIAVTTIAGSVTGVHQDGDFGITGARSVKLRLTRSQATITKIVDGLTLDVRDGECGISESAGAVEVDQIRSEVTVAAHRGTVTVRGSDGRITIQHPTAETRVDMRRAEVELVMAQAVPTTVLTSDEPVRLLLVGTPAFVLDAGTTDAAIQATDFGLTPDPRAPHARLSHTFGGGTVRVSLRNTRGEIIVRKNQ